MLAKIRAAHPFSPDQLGALDGLLAETLTGVLRPLPPGAVGKQDWDGWGRPYFGGSWLSAPFLWAESYFYRRLLEATGYYGDGPWRGVDPFAFLKAAELTTPDLARELDSLDAAARTRALLHAALWGNQADLGFRIGVAAQSGQVGPAAHLVADDTAAVESRLAAGLDCLVLVADNAGRELLADLILLDHLLRTGAVQRAVLHLKPAPYYVSDATTADLAQCLWRLAAAQGQAADIARRIREAFGTGRLSIRAHPFYCQPLSFHHVPADLGAEFSAAGLVVLKGDLNYRRLVGDCRWPPATPFAETAGYFPGLVASLRTLKSDVVVGVGEDAVKALDAQDPDWRTNGRYALVQAR
jgi:hypothetical protein